jgi:hypothetical protein
VHHSRTIARKLTTSTTGGTFLWKKTLAVEVAVTEF